MERKAWFKCSCGAEKEVEDSYPQKDPWIQAHEEHGSLALSSGISATITSATIYTPERTPEEQFAHDALLALRAHDLPGVVDAYHAYLDATGKDA